MQKFFDDCNIIVNYMRSHVPKQNVGPTWEKNLDSDIKVIKSTFNKNILRYENQNKDILHPIDVINAFKELIVKTLRNELNGKTDFKKNIIKHGRWFRRSCLHV